MTKNQIEYAKLIETRRHNKAGEAETARSNRAQEGIIQEYNAQTISLRDKELAESIRAHLMSEDLQTQSLQETARANIARESETARSNLAHEIETQRSNFAKEQEMYRSNVARETETHRSNLASEGVARTNATSNRISAEANRTQAEAAKTRATTDFLQYREQQKQNERVVNLRQQELAEEIRSNKAEEQLKHEATTTGAGNALIAGTIPTLITTAVKLLGS